MPIFITLIKHLKKLTHRLTRSDMVNVVIATVALIGVGTVAYALIEGWSWLDALYATIITMTTVGYGDLSPQTIPGRAFAIVFTIFAIGIGGYAISTLAAYVIERQATHRTRYLRKNRMSTIADLNQHFIICGANKLAQGLALELRNLNQQLIIVSQDEALLKETMLMLHPEYFQHFLANISDFADDGGAMATYEAMPLAEISAIVNIPYLLADPTDDSVLLHAGIGRARGLVPCLPDDRDNLSIVVGARALAGRFQNENLRIMSRVEDLHYLRKILISGAHEIRHPGVVTGYQMASHLLNPEFSAWWGQMLITDAPRFGDASTAEHPDWIGATVSDVRRQHGQLVIAIKRGDEYISAPLPEEGIQAEDILILFGLRSSV